MPGLCCLISLGSSFHCLWEPVRKEEVSGSSCTLLSSQTASEIPQIGVGMTLTCLLFLYRHRAGRSHSKVSRSRIKLCNHITSFHPQKYSLTSSFPLPSSGSNVKFRKTAAAGAAAAAAPPSWVPMRPGAHSFLCCGLLTLLFVSGVMGTELMERGACSQQMAPVGFFTLLAPYSDPSCVDMNLGKFCYFSGLAPGSLQQSRQQKQALKYLLRCSGRPQQLFIALHFPSLSELSNVQGLKHHHPVWLWKAHELLVSCGYYPQWFLACGPWAILIDVRHWTR